MCVKINEGTCLSSGRACTYLMRMVNQLPSVRKWEWVYPLNHWYFCVLGAGSPPRGHHPPPGLATPSQPFKQMAPLPLCEHTQWWGPRSLEKKNKKTSHSIAIVQILSSSLGWAKICFPVTFTCLVSSVLWNNQEYIDFRLLCSGLVAYMVPLCGLEKWAHLLPSAAWVPENKRDRRTRAGCTVVSELIAMSAPLSRLFCIYLIPSTFFRQWVFRIP